MRACWHIDFNRLTKEAQMKKIVLIACLFAVLRLKIATASADTGFTNRDFSEMFVEHGAVMLIIDPESGSIDYANKAATDFYGYEKEELLSMKITQINVLTPEQTITEMEAAVVENRNYFLFEHQLSNGEIRNVEVYSYPVHFNDKTKLFSIIYDITEKVELQKKHENITRYIFISGVAVILILIFMINFLIYNLRKLKRANNQLDNFNSLRKTFIDADKRLTYLKDENLNYVFVNQAVEKFYNKTSQEIIGKDDFYLTNDSFAEDRRRSDMKVLNTGDLIVDEEERNGKIYQTTKFPVEMLNGKFGVGAYIKEITLEKEQEQRQKRVLLRHMILVDVLTKDFHGKEEQLDYVLHKALELTESQYGYIYYYDEIKQEFTLNTWTMGVMSECEIVNKQAKYQLESTGIWGEVVRQRKPIIVNDFEQKNELKKGYPQGHVPLRKFMSVPVMIDEKIVAAIGLANKKVDYDDNEYENDEEYDDE